MKIYLAHNFDARIFLRESILPRLAELGHYVTSSWITDDSHTLVGNSTNNAIFDIDDIDKADALLLYTNQYSEKPGKGKWFEFGYAYGKNKKIFLIGDDMTCVFTHLPNVYHIRSIDEIPN